MRISSRIRIALIVALIAAAASGCSRSAQDYVNRGDAALKAGKIDAAVLEYRNAVGKDPMFAPARACADESSRL